MRRPNKGCIPKPRYPTTTRVASCPGASKHRIRASRSHAADCIGRLQLRCAYVAGQRHDALLRWAAMGSNQCRLWWSSCTIGAIWQSDAVLWRRCRLGSCGVAESRHQRVVRLLGLCRQLRGRDAGNEDAGVRVRLLRLVRTPSKTHDLSYSSGGVG